MKTVTFSLAAAVYTSKAQNARRMELHLLTVYLLYVEHVPYIQTSTQGWLCNLEQIVFIYQLDTCILKTSYEMPHYFVDGEVEQEWQNETYLLNIASRFE